MIGKLFLYFKLLYHTDHRQARHNVFHKKHESWELHRFDLSKDGEFWESDHWVTCKKCNISYMAHRVQFGPDIGQGIGASRGEAFEIAKGIKE